VQIDTREIVLLLSQCGLGGSRLIFAGRLNVAERDELLRHCLRGGGIHAEIGDCGSQSPHTNLAKVRRD